MTDPENPVIRGDGRGNLNSFMGIGDSVLFRLKDHAGAGQVELAGSFNNWQWGELLMEKTAAGWELPIALGPGNHEYKYIVDGKWITDPGNPYLSGSGEYANSVLALKPTHSFTLNGYSNARKVIVCGSFNGWNEDGYRMAKTDGGWIFPIHLRPGKYTYKFILDGRWILDPGNDLWEENEYGTDNSVLWIK
jgi:1,4-alpha-glucan branching enzyme